LGSDSLLYIGYIGDAAHHFVASVEKPNWLSISMATRQRRKQTLPPCWREVPSGQRISAVHFPFPGLEKIERNGGRFVWVRE
jgi:hypothetical protein